MDQEQSSPPMFESPITYTPNYTLPPTPILIEYGSEVEEIINSRMPLIVRWGTVIFCFILLIVCFLTWIIEYPDVVMATGKLNSINAPQQVVAKNAGRLIHIAVQEKDVVQKGQILGYIESVAKPSNIKYVDDNIKIIDKLLRQDRNEEILELFPAVFNADQSSELGEMQSDYQVFVDSYLQFKETLHQGYLQKKMRSLYNELNNLTRMTTILHEQQKLLAQDLLLTNRTYEANKVLAENNVIALFDFRSEESKLIAKQLTIHNINTTIISNELEIIQKNKEITDLNSQIIAQKYAFIRAVRTIESQIQIWKFKYILRAPVAGIVNFTGFFQENQELKLNQTLFYIQPRNSLYFVEIVIPQYNFGKVKIGQTVALKFDAFIFEQYGTVTGKIQYIKSNPTNKGYLAKVWLPNGLLTTRNQQLHYRQGLTVQAEIVTENMRLLERLYNSMFKQMVLVK